MNTKDLVFVSLFAAIIVALGLIPPITLGFVPVPITAQSFGVMLAGMVLGAKRGVVAVLLVVALVTIGMPVLSGGRGGLAVYAGPTVGFFIGWLPAVLTTGFLAQRLIKRSQSSLIQLFGFAFASIFGCILVLYLTGIIGIMAITGLSFDKALIGSMIFVPGDLIKAILAAVVARSVYTNYPLLPKEI
ncbi:biotin transporter BioY [Ochrobactrum sp. Marseille-Q0166]|uniref:biotin transporter BioY n=1 Tax=Ochrobactrum sp. Marseille-Q0166 TaxID=2761105 RepID=UPI00165519C7|nr:biotin transporter BioY [Ochrobactrum sp. Marseille-Q0166]MBC8718994.1 biotin transporter BioY [Ochrobactrum sp. Marseille-Q0166]